jgi:hypothetical protein
LGLDGVEISEERLLVSAFGVFLCAFEVFVIFLPGFYCGQGWK